MTNPFFNVELEQQILGGVLLKNDLFDLISDKVTAETFYEPAHQLIWENIAQRMKKDHLASPITLATDLRDHEALKELGGVGYLARLAGASMLENAIEDAANELRRLKQRSNLHTRLETAQEALKGAGGMAEAEMELSRALGEISADDGKSSSVSFLKAATDTIANMNKAYAGGSQAVQTGIPVLDKSLGGFWDGDLIVLGGRPSMGKSALAIDIATNVAKTGKAVAVWSLEMTEESIAQRIIASKSGVKYSEARRGAISDDQFRSIVESTKALVGGKEALCMEIIPPHVRDISAGYAAAKAARAKMGDLGLVVVDYLQLISAPGKSRYEKMTDVSLGLKHMAKMLNVPVLALAQLSRRIEEREDKRPALSDLRESGQIEQDADAVLFCYRDHYYLSREGAPKSVSAQADYEAALHASKGLMEIIVGKQRMGDIGILKVGCDVATNRFWDLSNPPTQEPSLGDLKDTHGIHDTDDMPF